MNRFALPTLLAAAALAATPAFAHLGENQLAVRVEDGRIAIEVSPIFARLAERLGIDADGNGRVTPAEAREADAEIEAYIASRIVVSVDGTTLAPVSVGPVNWGPDHHGVEETGSVVVPLVYCPAAPPRILRMSAPLFPETEARDRPGLAIIRYAVGKRRLTRVMPIPTGGAFIELDLSPPTGRGRTLVPAILGSVLLAGAVLVIVRRRASRPERAAPDGKRI